MAQEGGGVGGEAEGSSGVAWGGGVVEAGGGGGEEEEEEVLAGGCAALQVDARKGVGAVAGVGCVAEVCQGNGGKGAAAAGMFRLTCADVCRMPDVG